MSMISKKYLNLLVCGDTDKSVVDSIYDFYNDSNSRNSTDIDSVKWEWLPSLLGRLAELDKPQISRNFYALIREKEVKDLNKALYKLSFLPEDLCQIAKKIQNVHGQLARDLRRIAEIKSKLIKSKVSESNEYLPDIAFPGVFSQAKYRFVLWAFFKVPETDTPSSKRNFSFEHSIRLLMENLGFSVDGANLVCPFLEVKELNLDGSSASLAFFTTLWLSLTGVRPRHGKIALTGEVSVKGEVKEVADINFKIKTALSSGYSFVFVPLRNFQTNDIALKAKGIFDEDPRVIKVSSVFELINWFCLHDPINRARQMLRGLFQNVVAVRSGVGNDPFKSLKAYVAKELRKDRLSEAIWSLRRKGFFSRKIELNEYFSLYGFIFKILVSLIDDYNKSKRYKKRFDMLVWLGIFKNIVPESIFFLHVPIILERYSSRLRVQAFNLYYRMAPDFAFHDLNLTLASIWFKKLFKNSVKCKWFDESLRSKYPLLALFLFTDVFEALFYLTSWNKLLQHEQEWLTSITDQFIKKMKSKDAVSFSHPGFPWEGINNEILKKAFAKTLPDYSPNPGNITSYEKRPLKIFQILKNDTNGRLDPVFCKQARLFACNMLRSLHAPNSNSTFQADVIKRIETNDLTRIRRAEKKNIHQTVLQCYELLLCGSGKIRKSSKTGNLSWSERLSEALDHKKGSQIVRKKIGTIDRALNKALVGFFQGSALCGNSSKNECLSFQFQCLANPALGLTCLAIDNRFGRKKISHDQLARMVILWYQTVTDHMGAELGFRQLLVQECLYYFSGKLVAAGYISDKAIPPKLKEKTGYCFGFYGAQQVLSKGIEDKLVRDIAKKEFRSLIWLVWVKDETFQKKILNETIHLKEKESSNTKLIILIAFLKNIWPELSEWNNYDKKVLNSADNLLQRFNDQPDSSFENKSIVQGILPFAIFKTKQLTCPHNIDRIGIALAGTKGFSPLALSLINNDIVSEDPLRHPYWWELSWEREMFMTIYIVGLFLDNETERMRALIAHPNIDLKNAALLNRLNSIPDLLVV
jgi:hypothetical protein